MIRFTTALACALAAAGAAAAQGSPPQQLAAVSGAPPKAAWVGVKVIDRDGRAVGPVEGVVWTAKGGPRVMITIRGHIAWAPISTLTLKGDGTAVSTMHREDIYLTYPGCHLC